MWFYFRFHKVKLKNIPAALVENSDNPVLHILTPILDYPPEERLIRTLGAYIKLHEQLSPRLFQKYLDFVDTYAKIQPEERQEFLKIMENEKGGIMIREYLRDEGIKIGEARGFKLGKEEGHEDIALNLLKMGMLYPSSNCASDFNPPFTN